MLISRNSPAPEGPSGVSIYVGVTGAGKSFQAMSHAHALAHRHRWPVLALDLEDGLKHPTRDTHSVRDAVHHVWTLGESVVWKPSATVDTRDAVQALLRATRAGGRCVLLVDGLHTITDAHARRSDPFITLLREHRHAEAWVLGTSQHYSGDVAQSMLACVPTLHFFRTTQPATMKVLQRDEGLDPDVIRRLPVGDHVRVHHGF